MDTRSKAVERAKAIKILMNNDSQITLGQGHALSCLYEEMAAAKASPDSSALESIYAAADAVLNAFGLAVPAKL